MRLKQFTFITIALFSALLASTALRADDLTLENHFGLTPGASAQTVQAAVVAANRMLWHWPQPASRAHEKRMAEFARLLANTNIAAAKVPILEMEQLTWKLSAYNIPVRSSTMAKLVTKTLRDAQANPTTMMEALKQMSKNQSAEFLETHVRPALWDGETFLVSERLEKSPFEILLDAKARMSEENFRSFVEAYGTTLSEAERALDYPSDGRTYRAVRKLRERQLGSSEGASAIADFGPRPARPLKSLAGVMSLIGGGAEGSARARVMGYLGGTTSAGCLVTYLLMN